MAVALSNRRMFTMVAGAFIVPAVFIGGYTLLRQGSKSTVSGTIQLGEEPPTSPNRCESGVLSKDAPPTRAQWHGVDLFDAAHPARRVRVIDDPEKGGIVTLRDGDAAPIVVNRDACKKFAIQIRDTGHMIFDHYGLEGAIDLDCSELVAAVKFESCYDGS
jgi:hypothetical protein